ncbi:Omp28-related outer membrane protein [Nonlabens xiamenensis]|uniref:Omp28-related outer membrane protein n=1 Tax=Nonlabens xiamenensis TaxID=2341043 RepID=UPI000F6062B3|nr:Omp28-related outer membrane protein [Nonlabens xiamenensis]
MKITNYFKILTLFLAVSIASCSSEGTDDGDTSSNNNELTLEVNKSQVFDNTSVVVTVFRGSTDVTSQAAITVDDVALTGNIARLVGTGTKSIMATIDTETSNTVTVEVIEPSYTTKMLIEDYTGAWCGWCPRMSQSIENLNAQDNGDKYISIAIHNGDSMTFSGEGQMRNQFGVRGFPTGILNRGADWNAQSGDAMNLSQPAGYLQEVVPVGLAINSSVSGSTVTTTVKTGFDLDQENLKLVVYVLENNLTENQTNYTNNYGGASTIVNFEHDHVLRANLTNLFGDDIPADQQAAGNVYETTLSANVSSLRNANNAEIVAFVVNDSGSVVNVQRAAIGVNQDFD